MRVEVESVAGLLIRCRDKGFFDETSVNGGRRADSGTAPVRDVYSCRLDNVSYTRVSQERRSGTLFAKSCAGEKLCRDGPEPPVPLRSGLLNGTGNRPSACLYCPNGGLCPECTVMQVVAKYPNGRCGKSSERCLERTGLLSGGPSKVVYTRRRRTACPWPPPPQSAAIPYSTSRSLISTASVCTRRNPLAPKGCPSAIAPPFTFTMSSSSPSA
jgi:hypothetical protein